MTGAYGFPKYESGKRHVPDYYRFKARTVEGEVIELDAFDFLGNIDGIHPLVFEAMKHLIRAGRKPGNPFMKDITKAMEALGRLLE